MTLGLYPAIALLVLCMNVLPAFMPATWVVLAFFYITFHLQLIPLVIIGATFATAGRVLLYYFSKHFIRHYLSASSQENFDALGEYFKKHNHLTIPVVLGYAFLPIPSNNVFIAAGLAKLDIKIIAFSFFLGRLISYTFWISVASRINRNLSDIFANHLSNINGIIIEVLSLLTIVILSKINWKHFINKSKEKSS